MKKSLLVASSVLVLATIPTLHAQVTYSTVESALIQDFGALPDPVSGSSHTNFTWTNNSTLTGWYYTSGANFNSAFSSTGGRSFNSGAATASAFNTNRILSVAPSGDLTENALGLSGATGAVGGAFGIRIQNTTGFTLTQFSLSYTGEQWGQTANAGSLNFYYLVTAGNSNPTSFGTAGLDVLANGTSIPQLGFTAPNTGTTATLDGNAAGNNTSISGTATGLNWAAGTDLYLVWYKPTDQSILAIDNLSFSATAIPEPSAFAALAGLGSIGLVATRRRRVRA